MDFINALGQLIIPAEAQLFMIAAIFTRMSLFVFLLPGLGETGIPVRIRLVTALVLTWMLLPVLLPVYSGLELTIARFFLLLLGEAFYGFVLGFSFRIMIYVLQIAGTIIAQAMSLSQIFGASMTEEPNTTVSTMLIMAGLTLAVTMNLHFEAVRIFITSYTIFPLGASPDKESMAYWAAEKSVGTIGFALSLALPFVILNFIYNLALGVISRAMPQLMVAFVGIPAITGAGLFLLAIAVVGILLTWLAGFEAVFLDYEGAG